MPIIDQEDFDKLNNKLQFQEKTLKNTEEENSEIKKHRLILLIISAVLFLLLLTGLLTYIFSPSSFMSVSKFEKQGYKVMPEAEYAQIKEILEMQSSDSLDTETSNSNDDEYTDGSSTEDKTIYAVQVAAFEEKGIELYSSNLIQFSENQNDDFYKYSLGAFETLDEAQQFRKELLKLGFRDAFVASYKNGNRLKIEEAW